MHIRDGKSQRQISKETRICRETITKDINDYENKLVTVNENLNEEERQILLKILRLNRNTLRVTGPEEL